MKINAYDTLVEATEDLNERGFSDQFIYKDGLLHNVDSEVDYHPNQLKIVEYHRFEGMTNPSDMSVIFALETVQGEKGTAVMSYTSDADMDLVSFFDKVKIKSHSQVTNH